VTDKYKELTITNATHWVRVGKGNKLRLELCHVIPCVLKNKNKVLVFVGVKKKIMYVPKSFVQEREPVTSY